MEIKQKGFFSGITFLCFCKQYYFDITDQWGRGASDIAELHNNKFFEILLIM